MTPWIGTDAICHQARKRRGTGRKQAGREGGGSDRGTGAGICRRLETTPPPPVPSVRSVPLLSMGTVGAPAQDWWQGPREGDGPRIPCQAGAAAQERGGSGRPTSGPVRGQGRRRERPRCLPWLPGPRCLSQAGTATPGRCSRARRSPHRRSTSHTSVRPYRSSVGTTCTGMLQGRFCRCRSRIIATAGSATWIKVMHGRSFMVGTPEGEGKEGRRHSAPWGRLGHGATARARCRVKGGEPCGIPATGQGLAGSQPRGAATGTVPHTWAARRQAKSAMDHAGESLPASHSRCAFRQDSRTAVPSWSSVKHRRAASVRTLGRTSATYRARAAGPGTAARTEREC